MRRLWRRRDGAGLGLVVVLVAVGVAGLARADAGRLAHWRQAVDALRAQEADLDRRLWQARQASEARLADLARLVARLQADERGQQAWLELCRRTAPPQAELMRDARAARDASETLRRQVEAARSFPCASADDLAAYETALRDARELARLIEGLRGDARAAAQAVTGPFDASAAAGRDAEALRDTFNLDAYAKLRRTRLEPASNAARQALETFAALMPELDSLIARRHALHEALAAEEPGAGALAPLRRALAMPAAWRVQPDEVERQRRALSRRVQDWRAGLDRLAATAPPAACGDPEIAARAMAAVDYAHQLAPFRVVAIDKLRRQCAGRQGGARQPD